jgi:hypothetical protein
MDNKELEEFEKAGFTCLECNHFPCSDNQQTIKPLCFSFSEVKCQYYECPYTNPVCYLYCKA